MANIRTDIIYTIIDGAEVVFKAPCDCSEVTGLTVYYPDSEGEETSMTFAFKDAHGNDLADIENTFKEGAYVKVILNTTELAAYIQNADTNAYLEGRFDDIINGETAVGIAEYIKAKNGYSFNLKGLSTQKTMWFNYVNGDTESDDTTNPIEQYYFADKAKGTKNGLVKLDLTKGTGIREILHTGNYSDLIDVIEGNVTPLEIKSLSETDARSLVAFYVKAAKQGYLGFNGVGNPVYVTADGVPYKILHDGNYSAFALPKSGGSVTGHLGANSGSAIFMGTSTEAQVINRNDKNSTDNQRSLVVFNSSGKSDVKEALGLRDRVNGVDTVYNVLHAGNKPSGTYTGNGSATARTISTGGIGNVCAVYHNGNGVALVTTLGAITCDSNGVAYLKREEARFTNGDLILNTANKVLNADTDSKYYQVL